MKYGMNGPQSTVPAANQLHDAFRTVRKAGKNLKQKHAITVLLDIKNDHSECGQEYSDFHFRNILIGDYGDRNSESSSPRFPPSLPLIDIDRSPSRLIASLREDSS